MCIFAEHNFHVITHRSLHFLLLVENKAKWLISKRVLKENKPLQVLQKTNILYPVICTRTRAYKEGRNVRLWKNLAYFVFLLHPFWEFRFHGLIIPFVLFFKTVYHIAWVWSNFFKVFTHWHLFNILQSFWFVVNKCMLLRFWRWGRFFRCRFFRSWKWCGFFRWGSYKSWSRSRKVLGAGGVLDVIFSSCLDVFS